MIHCSDNCCQYEAGVQFLGQGVQGVQGVQGEKLQIDTDV